MVPLSVRIDDVIRFLVEKGADDRDVKTAEDARQAIREFENAASTLAHLAFVAGTKF